MMGMAARVDDLDLPTYEAILDNWNAAHSRDGDQVDLPDPKVMQARLDAINAAPRLTH